MDDNSKNLLEGSFVDDELGFGSSFVKDGLSERNIVLEQFRRCLVEGSKAVISGENKQQEIFINAVMMLEIALLPKMMRFPKIKSKNDIVDTQIDELEKGFTTKTNTTLKKCQTNQKLNIQNELSKVEQLFERKLVKTYRIKLGALAFMLDEINFYAEKSI